jgi:hypothetical protein
MISSAQQYRGAVANTQRAGRAMAFLFFNSRRMGLNPALQNIGEFKLAIFDELQRNGFADIANTASEVAGTRNGVRVSILHLFIANRDFWQVFMAGGDTAETTLGTLNEVVRRVDDLKFL